MASTTLTVSRASPVPSLMVRQTWWSVRDTSPTTGAGLRRGTDTYSGYRAFAPDALRCVSLCGDRYESELEIVFCMTRARMRIIEVPIPKIYGDATSKMAARHGAFLGRVTVVKGYARTILREIRTPDTQEVARIATMAQ